MIKNSMNVTVLVCANKVAYLTMPCHQAALYCSMITNCSPHEPAKPQAKGANPKRP